MNETIRRNKKKFPLIFRDRTSEKKNSIKIKEEMNMKKKLLSVALSAAMVLSLAACGNDAGNSGTAQSGIPEQSAASSESDANVPAAPQESSQEAQAEEDPVTCTLKVWAPSEDQDQEYGAWLQTMCEQFNGLHPNWDITFEYGVCTESDARKQVLNDLEAAADVFLFSSTNLEYFCKEQALAELGGKYLDTVNQHYSPTLVKSLTYEDGGVYGVPLTTNTYFMYYDKSVFSEEDIKSMNKMLEKGKISVQLDNGFYNACFFLGAGGTFFGEDGMDRESGVKFYSDEGVAMTEYLVDLAKNENFVSVSPEDAISMMREGTVNAYFCGTWQAAQTQEILGDNFGVAPLPSVNVGGTDYQLRPFNSAKGIGVKSTTQYPQVAIELALYLGGYDSEQYHYEKRGYVPCYDEYLATAEIQADEVVMVDSYTVSNIAVPRMSFTEMSWFWTPAESFGKEILSGAVTKENASEKLRAFEAAANSSGLE